MYYKYLDKSFNPLNDCKTIKLGTFNDYIKNHEDNDFVHDPNEGKWLYTFKPDQDCIIERCSFDKWFMANQIKVARGGSAILTNNTINSIVDGLSVEVLNKQCNLNNNHEDKFLTLTNGDEFVFDIKAPNTLMFCVANKPYPDDQKPYDDCYQISKLILNDFAQELRKLILRDIRGKFKNGVLNTKIPNFNPNKIKCDVKIEECFYYEYLNNFNQDWELAEQIFKNAQSIFYIKDKKYSYQNETRILFPISYPVQYDKYQILGFPQNDLILNLSNDMLNKIKSCNLEMV